MERILAPITDHARAETFRKSFSSEGGQALLNRDLLTQKAVARLREIVTGKRAEETEIAPAAAEAGTPAAEEPAAGAPETAAAPEIAAAGSAAPTVETPAS